MTVEDVSGGVGDHAATGSGLFVEQTEAIKYCVVGVGEELNEEFTVGLRFDFGDDVAELVESVGGDGNDSR